MPEMMGSVDELECTIRALQSIYAFEDLKKAAIIRVKAIRVLDRAWSYCLRDMPDGVGSPFSKIIEQFLSNPSCSEPATARGSD